MEPVPCTPTEECRYYPCFTDTHHLYYPRRRYKTQVEREFRNLPENKVEMCRAAHTELHATEQIPKKPGRDEMLQAIAAHMIQEAS